MILDTLDRLGLYEFPEKEAVLAFLQREDLFSLADGRHEVSETAYVNSGCFDVRDNRRLEGHRVYIDVQIVLDGAECIYWAPVGSGATPTEYNAEKDVYFCEFGDAPISSAHVGSGMFALFFPDELHAPLNSAGSAYSRKLIFKIPIAR